MLTKIIDIKEFSHFLKVNRNYIVELWLQTEDVLHIFNKHSLPIIDKNIIVFHELCDCFINTFEYDFAIEQCQVRINFLKLLHNYQVTSIELYTLVLLLKESIEHVIYENDYYSYSLKTEFTTVVIKIATELTQNYSDIQDKDIDYKSEHSNLLSEYKRSVDLSNIVSKTNPKGIITYVNDKFCEISGYTRSELIGKPHNIVRHPAMDKNAFKELWDTIKAKKPWQGVIKNLKKNGTQYIVDSTVIPILDIDGDIVEYIAVRHDITELEETKEQLRNINSLMKSKVDELYSMTTSLEEKASLDQLTGIYNRDKFEKLFTFMVEQTLNSNKDLSLIVFDIDYFKEVNDTYGHQAGDSVLQDLARLILKNIKTSDIFARWGGEEFVILLPDTTVEGAYKFAEKLRTLIKEYPFESVDKITSSFGVGQLNEYENKMTLFEKVDKALYNAKNSGRDRVEKALYNCIS
jgi:diguanylate cyclase (GGDEF)-like protein/PAS domain S-box-containing protein